MDRPVEECAYCQLSSETAVLVNHVNVNDQTKDVDQVTVVSAASGNSVVAHVLAGVRGESVADCHRFFPGKGGPACRVAAALLSSRSR
ncbi:hypothetical protein BaRGS_00023118 [Batillaria attramentaria]|uniref:Uncharacterized protein n=1 Tax=Batillaria attramentaria TaxID=370345 RepID=A0ABD0KEY1_9CAEN